jgi:P-type Cu+ transporter
MEETFGLQDYANGTVVQSVDPVCGMTVDESQAAAKAQYAGQIYYFCSRECYKTFQEDPGIYIGQRR